MGGDVGSHVLELQVRVIFHSSLPFSAQDNPKVAGPLNLPHSYDVRVPRIDRTQQELPAEKKAVYFTGDPTRVPCDRFGRDYVGCEGSGQESFKNWCWGKACNLSFRGFDYSS